MPRKNTHRCRPVFGNTSGRIAWVVMLVAGLTLAGCDNSADNPANDIVPVEILVPPPAKAPVKKSNDPHTQADKTTKQHEQEQPASPPAHEVEKIHKPLDLSLPPQPAVVPDPSSSNKINKKHILPDLFQPTQKSKDDRSPHLRGRVLMDQAVEQDLDAVEGGEIIIEMKTK